MKHIFTQLLIALLFASGAAFAGGHKHGDKHGHHHDTAEIKKTVQVFYDFLSNPSSEAHAEKFLAISAENWESIGDYSGKANDRDGLIKALAGFGQLIPDLEWQVEDMIVAGNKVIVRGRATGTPNGPLFGVDGAGKSFEILSIDIHEMEDGLMRRSYHVEDWAGAMRQLRGE